VFVIVPWLVTLTGPPTQIYVYMYIESEKKRTMIVKRNAIGLRANIVKASSVERERDRERERGR